MPKVLKIKKCIDLHLAGGVPADCRPVRANITKIALYPDDFEGLTPKPDVKEGDRVKAGDPLWHDKADADICVVAPVGGTVAAVERGEKRKLIRIIVDVDPDNNGVEGGASKKALAEGEETVSAAMSPQADTAATLPDADEIKRIIKRSGQWAMMRQLPYDIVPVDNRRPVNIFVSAWDSAPLAAGYDFFISAHATDIAKGVEALAALTDGHVYVGWHRDCPVTQMPKAERVEVEGYYPASLPSVLAANVAPVNKGETAWLLGIDTVARIGQAVAGKAVDHTFPVAVTGSEVLEPGLLSVPAGAGIKEMLDVTGMKETELNRRIISGNVFTGVKAEPDGYLRRPYRQLTVIPEGDDRTEFMGWASVSPRKMSSSRTFPSFFMRRKRFSPDARLNGGRRAMILSGEYDRYIPMDIMAEYLIKAILARDIERMEALGIYEVTPADFSAAEYADTSKLELQKIVREGLDYMIKEVGTAD